MASITKYDPPVDRLPVSLLQRARNCPYCSRVVESVRHGGAVEDALFAAVELMSEAIGRLKSELVDIAVHGVRPLVLVASEEERDRLLSRMEEGSKR